MKSHTKVTGAAGSEATITTSNRWRETLCWDDLTKKEQADLDWLDTPEKQSEASFLRAYGMAFCLGEVARWPHYGWDGVFNDTMFSAVLFKCSEDGLWMTGRLHS